MQLSYKLARHFFTISVIIVGMFNIGCKKLVVVAPPVTSLASASVYSSDATAAAVLTGIYTSLSSNSLPGGGLTSMSFYPSLSADELQLFGDLTPVYTAYYSNTLTSTNIGLTGLWDNVYPMIFTINSAIQGLSSATTLTSGIKQQLLGEAYFLRGFCYFYLVNLYGEVPLVTGINYIQNAVAPRTPLNVVYQQIISDLKQAQALLSPNYLDADIVTVTNDRVRPTDWAATALLARTYLYVGSWDSAEAEASTVINNSSLFGLSTLDSCFLMNSQEAIWQLEPVSVGTNTQDAETFILPSSGPSDAYPVYLSNFLLNAFELNDQRRTQWVDSVIVGSSIYYFPFKYKVSVIPSPVTEYTMVLRLGEQYLIRAEARAQQGDLAGADSDVNMIRDRAGLPGISSNSQAEAMNAVYHERQVELFTEWGQRWLDLKRSGQINVVMPAVCQQKGGVWNADWQLYPIPISDIKADPNLSQNAGY